MNLFFALWDNVIEYPLFKLGLMENPIKRFTVFSTGTALAVWIFKPKGLFDKEGSSYPSSIYSNDKSAVKVDWITASVIVGALGVLII